MGQKILGLDPGTTDTGYAIWDQDLKALIDVGVISNESLLVKLRFCEQENVVCEMFTNYGKVVGATVFQTCVWIGRFQEATRTKFHLMFRREVKLHFCKSLRVKKPAVREAIANCWDMDVKQAKGTKRDPGPLYGITNHSWDALGIAMTWAAKES